MWRPLALCLILVPCLFLPTANSQEKKAAKPPEISWHGQSFFTLTTSKGTVIVFDPHNIPAYGRVLGLKADIVLMSHPHNDHTQVGVIENFQDKNIKIIPGWKGGGKTPDWNIVDEEVKDVKIRSVGTYHDSLEGMRFGKSTAFIVEADGWKICHLGDLGHVLTPAQVKKIGPVDVVMVPVGGIYAMNGAEAREVVGQLKPKEYVFPMHMGTKIFDDLLPVDEFLEDTPKNRIAMHDDNRIQLNRDVTRPRPLVVLLHYWPKEGKEKETKEKEKEKSK